jgi:hypothetical protein
MLGPAASRRIEQLVDTLSAGDGQTTKAESLDHAVGLFDILARLKLPLDLWKSQNIFFPLVASVPPELRGRAASGDKDASSQAASFERLAGYLGFKVD